ncbi:transketolase [Moorella sp. Hama-1]|uniref:transketolase n=1 Tax=Moorella sp. Hama-1 TaxID=2138101 RepID=UPI000D64966D|nr:transketolase [Moorella sp. Hama-1]BCV20157.1 transketolase [Moorella sp. Hama-1]
MLNDYQELAATARQIRRHIIRMVGAAGSGHPGGSLSAADIMTALYFKVMRLDPARPDWPERDRFVLSKGHAAPVLYATLAERGFFPVDQLTTLRQLGSPLQGHPDRKSLPGVEVSTGSLGHGLAVANGMALAARLDGRDYRVYVLMGDGELEEGMVWEGAMAAAHYRLDNLTAIVDHNHLQIDGRVEEVMSPEPVAAKFQAFGWEVLAIDGHDFGQILGALERAREIKGRPTVIIAETVKGKGVSFMEKQAGWHGKAPKPEEVEKALAELG